MNEDEKLMLALMMLSNKLPLERHAYRFEQAPFVKDCICNFKDSIRILGARILDIVGSNKSTKKLSISDGDKAFPKLNREQVIQEAEQIISDGDGDKAELNGEVIKQILSRF
ncbi:hypothetical protein Tco_0902041 [Tanacetum coccineum]